MNLTRIAGQHPFQLFPETIRLVRVRARKRVYLVNGTTLSSEQLGGVYQFLVPKGIPFQDG